jgi:hypothetical protein
MTNLTKTGGLHIKYSPVNAAYLLMWHGSVLAVCETRKDAKAEMDFILRSCKLTEVQS